MNPEELARYVEWIDTDPYKPAGKTYLDIWNEKMKGDDLNKWF